MMLFLIEQYKQQIISLDKDISLIYEFDLP